ncbi:hypothetical protein [Promicromonospora sukumoe]|uniref:hypothetical protein n=1 Tax=Promicromonospora sukumoe TaxID=88382 RepID=UPI0012FA2D94|nr:hypothetical protein [Promicromonospora sukumoe]
MKQWARWLLIGVSAAVTALSGTFATVTANQVTRAGGSMILSNQFWIAAGVSFIAAVCAAITAQALTNAKHASREDLDRAPEPASTTEATVDRDAFNDARSVEINQGPSTVDSGLPHRQAVERHPQTTTRSPSEVTGAFRWFPEPLKRLIPTKWDLVRSLFLVAACWFSSIVAVTFLDMSGRPPGLESTDVLEPNLITWPALLLTFIAPWAVLFRKRYPAAICLATSAIPVLLPYDALTPLVVLPAVFTSRPLRITISCTAATSVAIAAAMARDLAMHDEYQILASPDPVTGSVDALPVTGYVVIGILCLAASIGTGLWLRLRAAGRNANPPGGAKPAIGPAEHDLD